MILSNIIARFGWDEGEVIATFGRARLVKKPDARYELVGGSMEDHLQAREWISLFMHEAVFFLRRG